MTIPILLIEDDGRLAAMLRDYLEQHDYHIRAVAHGEEGVARARQGSYALIILDLMLPDMDGLEVCRLIRSFDTIPILMLTAKGEPLDRVIGLELGADDYLPKPFEPRELLARIRALLRRTRQTPQTSQRRFGSLVLDLAAMTASLDDVPCELSAHQFRLLELLSRHPGRVQTRAALQQQLQGFDIDSSQRAIDVHISRIRAKIEPDPKHPRRILTIRGTGYIFSRIQGEEETT